MLLNIAIFDEDLTSNTLLISHLQRYEIAYNVDFKISVFENALDLLSAFHSSNSFHLLFLDENASNHNGIKLAEKIRNIPNKHVKIIFCCQSPKHMELSFFVQAFQYLQKPFSYESIHQLIDRVVTAYNTSQSYKIVITEEKTKQLIPIHKLLYIETQNSKKHL